MVKLRMALVQGIFALSSRQTILALLISIHILCPKIIFRDPSPTRSKALLQKLELYALSSKANEQFLVGGGGGGNARRFKLGMAFNTVAKTDCRFRAKSS